MMMYASLWVWVIKTALDGVVMFLDHTVLFLQNSAAQINNSEQAVATNGQNW